MRQPARPSGAILNEAIRAVILIVALHEVPMQVCEAFLRHPKEGSGYVLRQRLHPILDGDLDARA